MGGVADRQIVPASHAHSAHPLIGTIVVDVALTMGETAAPLFVELAACWRRTHHHEEGEERCRHRAQDVEPHEREMRTQRRLVERLKGCAVVTTSCECRCAILFTATNHISKESFQDSSQSVDTPISPQGGQ